ncbi:hypothetical protein OIV83_002558 [Microbotryomycetes sp. JL201]|nr:hypothetical protein OIV83_002558 [Microbotryomycetes sp. JL201]
MRDGSSRQVRTIFDAELMNADLNKATQGCVLCQSAHDVLGARPSPSPASQRQNEKRTSRDDDEEQSEFVLGSDDDEPSEEVDTVSEGARPVSPPPAYHNLADAPAPYDVHDEKCRDKLSVHYIKPQETLLGLSLQYRVDARYLCQINRLHPSALTTSPQLLHTLPFLLLPPHVNSTSSEPLLTPEQERRRLIIRRFQVHTRCSDYAMAAAYCNAIFDAREREADLVRQNRIARGDEVGAHSVMVRTGGELEEACRQYELDDKWEKEQGGKMGSRMRSTGQVESAVKGWSRPR